MKNFDDFDDDFYDKVDRHKDKLVADMLDNPSKTVFSRIFNRPNGFDNFFDEILDEMGKAPTKGSAPNVTTPDDGYSIDFHGSKSQQFHADFLCFQFFDLYQTVQSALKRYVYFELYFHDKALGVLMRKSTFNEPNQSLSAFDLDRREWAEAKQQMRMWSQYLRPETEEVSDLSSYGEDFIQQLLDSKTTSISKNDKTYIQTIDYIFSTPCFWPIIAYIGIIRLNPLLSPKQLPTFTLNLIQTEMTTYDFAQIMRKYLTLFPIFRREISDDSVAVVDQFKWAVYEKDDMPSNPDILNLLLFPYSNGGAISDCSKAFNEFVDIQSRKDTSLFPLQTIPILLGGAPSTNSAFLNHPVDTQFLSRLPYDDATAHVLSNLNTFFIQELSVFLNEDNNYLLTDTPDMLEKMRKRLKKRYERFDQYWIQVSGKFKYIPTEYIYLARWLTIIFDAKGLTNKTKSQSLLYQKLESNLVLLNNTYQGLHGSIDIFLKSILNNQGSFPSAKPTTAEAFNASPVPFHLDVAGQKLIIYPRELLPKELASVCPSIATEDAIKLLHQRGLLKTNKAEGDLTYGWSLDKTTRTYAILVDSIDFETKSEITTSVIGKIERIKNTSVKNKRR